MKKIVKVYFKENTTIEVLFDDGVYKRYDVLSLAGVYPQLNQLKNRELFLKGKVLGVSGIKWNDELDIDGDTIYSDGENVPPKEPIDNILLGFELKQERIKQGLSQQELAKLSGVDQGDISKIENGTANPTINTISKISTCLNKTIRYSLI